MAADEARRPSPGAGRGASAGRRRRAVLVALTLAVAAQVAVAWYPFRLDPPRPVTAEVTRQPGGSLGFSGTRIVARGLPPWEPGAALADEPRAHTGPAGAEGAGVAVDTVVAEVVARPATPAQEGPARILSVSWDLRSANLMIGQDRDSLVVRVRRPGSDLAGSPPLRVRRVFDGGDWVRTRVEVSPGRVTVAVDGEVRATVAVPGAPTTTWDPSYPVMVADERIGGRAWQGELREARLTADGRTVDYLQPGALALTERSWYVPSRLRERSLIPESPAAVRSGLHLLAFVPLGALIAAARRWRDRGRGAAASAHSSQLLPVVAWQALLLGTALQAGKVLFEGRHPSWLTVLAQVAGALLGALALWSVAAGRAARPGTSEPRSRR